MSSLVFKNCVLYNRISENVGPLFIKYITPSQNFNVYLPTQIWLLPPSFIFNLIKIDQATVKRSESIKLLGLTIDEKQNRKEQIHGTNGLVNALNHRMFTIRRIRIQIPKKDVIKIVQSLWMSKLRYGLQFCCQVRTKNDDPIIIKKKKRMTTQSIKMSKHYK